MYKRLNCQIALAVLVLGISQHWSSAADGDAITVDLKTFQFKVREEITSLFGYDEGESRLFFYTNGAGETTIKVSADGDYEITVKAACDPAQNEQAKFKVAVDGEPVGVETLLTADQPKDYKLSAKLKAGDRKLAIEFTNDTYKENEYDRNLFVHAVTLRRAK